MNEPKWDTTKTDYVAHTKFIDIAGERFGKLVAEYPVRIGTGKNSTRWSCNCDCGTIGHLVLPDNLRRSQVTSCGCTMFITGKEHFNAKWVGNIALGHIAVIKKGASSRDIEYNVSNEYLAKLFEDQNYLCALTGLPLVSANKPIPRTASLDRIDSKVGYVEGNLQWVHKMVNRMKLHYDQDDFIQMCCLIADKHRGG